MDQPLAFSDLISALKGCSVVGRAQPSFHVVSDESFFVPPELLLRGGFGGLDAAVILVSARGAAGKSRTAEEISRLLGAPLWKLEKDKAVGATSLTYVLSKYLGAVDVSSALENASSPMILIDSLDEARARVSGTSWAEFLESVAEEAARRSCRFIMFGRERTLEEAWFSLAEVDIEASWVEISHFGRTERRAYVDGVVGRRAGDAILRGGFYEKARDAVLSSVVSGVSGEAADAFAGYAPVLDAVAAVLLREDNHFTLFQTFGTAGNGGQHLAEVQRLLEDLLKRDQQKMQPLAWDLGLDPAAVYSPAEQLAWLCYELEQGPKPELAHIQDLKVRSDYIERVRPFLQDHPFRDEKRWASTVFAAYTASQMFGTTITGQRLVEIGNDSSLLFDLVALQEEPVIDEWGFAALHASITAGEFGGFLASVTVTEAAAGEFEVVMSLRHTGAPFQKSFALLSSTADVLDLHGPLEGLTVSTTGDLSIPAREAPPVLGPDIFLHCHGLSVDGPTVEFAHRASPMTKGGDPDAMVVLEVTGQKLRLPLAISREPRPGTFELRVPAETKLAYPWTNYREQLEVSETVDSNVRAARFLKMFMNLTRAHGHHGERGTFVKKLRGRQGLKGADFQAAIDVLKERGIALTNGELIYLSEDYEKHRFSGKNIDGQRLIEDVWDVWGPVVDEISKRID